ncbi:hypothetical protein [Streptomyces sp. NPDC052727]|uniref:hypothetical protein n=1 Tax=unclassified Streptomyces TaxID=2593676 RepID=UPI00342DA7A0
MQLTTDAVTGEATLDHLPDAWDERTREIVRPALPAHRERAALVAGTHPAARCRMPHGG